MSDRQDLPAKLYYRIGEVAGLVGVEPHVLRYWEREFKSIKPQKSAKGQRVYSRRDVETLLRVRELLYRDGFTISGARKRLQKAGVEPETPQPEDGQALRETLLEVRMQVAAFLEELGG
jgi:DNA-binding transcriptional MerR regulator